MIAYLFIFILSIINITSLHCIKNVYEKTATIKKHVIILIHGAFATGSSGSGNNPTGHIYETLSQSVSQETFFKSFIWDGIPLASHIITAGKQCAEFIKKECSPSDSITIFSHSHGGNVATTASQYLENTQFTIDELYSLGTPISPIFYPNMNIIKSIFHFFSTIDAVQTLFNKYKRTYPYHKNIYNIRLIIDNLNTETHCYHELLHNFNLIKYYMTIKQHIINFTPSTQLLMTIKNDMKKFTIKNDILQTQIVNESTQLNNQMYEFFVIRQNQIKQVIINLLKNKK